MTSEQGELRFYITNNTLRLDVSRRGGGIEIDASEYLGLDGAKMTAYQNYLGGGLLGAVQSDRNFAISPAADGWRERSAKYADLADALKRYYHELTNEQAGEYDGNSASDYNANQDRAGSAY